MPHFLEGGLAEADVPADAIAAMQAIAPVIRGLIKSARRSAPPALQIP